MKNIFKIAIVLMVFSIGAKAQNLQTHYDFERGHITTTLEMFKPDALGNTFFFLDMDYNTDLSIGSSLAYFEIARVFKTEKMPVGVHVEFNSGFGTFDAAGNTTFFPINRAYLAGVDYSVNAADYSKGFSIKALYKYISRQDAALNLDGSEMNKSAFQITGVWYWHMLDRKLTFTGFADFWREDHVVFGDAGAETSKYIFLTEPQLWWNISDKIAVGGEVEISNDFGTDKGFKVRPTLGAKWTF